MLLQTGYRRLRAGDLEVVLLADTVRRVSYGKVSYPPAAVSVAVAPPGRVVQPGAYAGDDHVLAQIAAEARPEVVVRGYAREVRAACVHGCPGTGLAVVQRGDDGESYDKCEH